MQWTVDQIAAELGHLDVQILSYLERCIVGNKVNKAKLKTLRKWVKATTAMLMTCMYEIADQFPHVYSEIVNEQQAWGPARKDAGDERISVPHMQKRQPK